MDWRDLFVGRKTELDWLITKWNLAKEGEPQFVVLLGEPGLGKTRIALEFYRWLTCNEDPPFRRAFGRVLARRLRAGP